MAGKAPYGTILTFSGAPIAGITGFDGPNISAEVIDTTDMADRFQTFVMGLVDGGEVNLSINLLPSTAHMSSVLQGLSETDPADATVAWAITNDTQNLDVTFNGFVMKHGVKISRGNPMQLDLGIKVSGQPGYVP